MHTRFEVGVGALVSNSREPWHCVSFKHSPPERYSLDVQPSTHTPSRWANLQALQSAAPASVHPLAHSDEQAPHDASVDAVHADLTNSGLAGTVEHVEPLYMQREKAECFQVEVIGKVSQCQYGLCTHMNRTIRTIVHVRVGTYKGCICGPEMALVSSARTRLCCTVANKPCTPDPGSRLG